MPVSILPERPTFMSDEAWGLLLKQAEPLENVFRADASGRAYVDVDLIDSLVQKSKIAPLITAWQQFKPQVDETSLHSANPKDETLGVASFMRAQGGTGTPAQQQFVALLQQPFKSPEDAWAAAKKIEVLPQIQNVSAEKVTDYLRKVTKAMQQPASKEATADPKVASGPILTATVGDCFGQAGLWWVIVFCFFVVLLIVGTIMSGGTLAAVVSGIVGILVSAGIWATLGAIVALVVCLGGAFDIQINY
jgi:hypothetical protein